MPYSFTSICLKLVRFNISLMVLFSCFVGFYISGKRLDYQVLSLLLSVLLHSFGNSILNQYQEVASDSLMNRTKKRPIVTGKISKKTALKLAVLFLSVSFFIPLILERYLVVVILFLNLLTYNFIYTPLKKVTPLALLIGSISGALPPIVGWFFVKDGFEFSIIFIATTFYLWQVPHFLYLSEIYREEYENAGLKVLINSASVYKYKLIKTVWLLVYFFILTYSLVLNITKTSMFLYISLSILSAVFFMDFSGNTSKSRLKFNILNLSILLFVVSLVW